MRDVYAEYKSGLISWEEAYRIANNNSFVMTSSLMPVICCSFFLGTASVLS